MSRPIKISVLGLNKAFESRARLGIMSVLMVNDDADFTTLKQLLELTDGNLASHTRALEELGYISRLPRHRPGPPIIQGTPRRSRTVHQGTKIIFFALFTLKHKVLLKYNNLKSIHYGTAS